MSVLISRRRLLGTAAVLPAAVVHGWLLQASAQEERDQPYLPTATFGYATVASNINADTLFTEPITMMFFVYGFATEQDAIDAFPGVVAFLQDRADKLDAKVEADMEYSSVSIGPLGDEREGYYANPVDGAKDLLAIVRVGPNILYLRAMALGGDTVGFASEYLAGFLESTTDDPMSMVPEISDLPVGWELDEPVWADDIYEIIQTPIHDATPTP